MPTPPQRLRFDFYQGTFNRSTRMNIGFFLRFCRFLPLFFFSQFDELSQIMKSTHADSEDILKRRSM